LEPIQGFINPTDNPEYPQEWFLPLTLGLTKLICPMFHSIWTPDQEESFKIALAIAQKKEPERSALYFQPGED
jgi:hypothetical protein